MVGWAKNLTGSFAGGLYALAVCALASALISLFWLRIPKRSRGQRRSRGVAAGRVARCLTDREPAPVDG